MVVVFDDLVLYDHGNETTKTPVSWGWGSRGPRRLVWGRGLRRVVVTHVRRAGFGAEIMWVKIPFASSVVNQYVVL